MGVHFMGVHHRMQPFLLSRTYVFAAFGVPGLMPNFSFWAKWQLGTPSLGALRALCTACWDDWCDLCYREVAHMKLEKAVGFAWLTTIDEE